MLGALEPVILLLSLGVLAATASTALRLSPVVGFLALGLMLRGLGLDAWMDGNAAVLLTSLGIVFLLFETGLHVSLAHVQAQAATIVGLGALQIAFSTAGLGGAAWLAGLPLLPALTIGAVLALSSTAVVALIIAERSQQNCPVGQTATSILVFQDLAAVLLLIVADNASGSPAAMVARVGLALAKTAASFAVAMMMRPLIRPLFGLVAQRSSEGVFTAIALLLALAAGLATEAAGLSLTLGAFLGGMIVADTSYRPAIMSEIRPFRALLLSFFFISVGASLDLAVLLRHGPEIALMTLGLVLIKTAANAAASLVFRWSVPGSVQLGVLLAQGSEFAFLALSLPAIRRAVGETNAAMLIAAVAISLAATPSLAKIGRELAGRLRMRRPMLQDPELQPGAPTEPVLIVGMGAVGRIVADTMVEFGIAYVAVEHDPRRLSRALADGYRVLFGDMQDPRLWNTLALQGRRISIVTEAEYGALVELAPLDRWLHPTLKRIAVVADEAGAARFRSLGMMAVIDAATPPGLDAARAVLLHVAPDTQAVTTWWEQRAVAGALA